MNTDSTPRNSADRPTGAYRDRLLRLLAASINRGDLVSVLLLTNRLGLRPDRG